MGLSADDRAELYEAVSTAFPAPPDLGEFLSYAFNRNLAIINADRPDTIGLYEYVIRLFESEGRLVEFLDRAYEKKSNPQLETVCSKVKQRLQSNEVVSQNAKQGIRALVTLGQSPEVHASTQSIEQSFRTASDEIEEINKCKRMHEYLHRTQAQFPQLTAKNYILRGLLLDGEDKEEAQSRCEAAWMDLGGFVNGGFWSTCIVDLLDYARSGAFERETVLWEGTIQHAQDDLVKACEDCNTKLLEAGSNRIAQVLGKWPTRFDDRLFDAAQRLRLQLVVGELERIHAAISEANHGTDVTSQLETLKQGIAGLSELDKRLQDLVATHHCLQYIDVSMQTVPYPCTCGDDIGKITFVWSDLQESMDSLPKRSDAPWMERFVKTRQDLGKALETEMNDDSDAKTISKISGLFGRYQTAVQTGFTQVDQELLKLCDKLKAVGQELKDAIREMS